MKTLSWYLDIVSSLVKYLEIKLLLRTTFM